MKINTKLVLVMGIALLSTSFIIGLIAVIQVNRTGKAAVEEIEALGRENIQRIEADGKRQIEGFKEELLARKKEYLESQVQTAIGVLEKGYTDAHDSLKLKKVYSEQLQNAVNTAYGILAAVEKEEGLSVAEKKDKAKHLIEALRYGPDNKDYFWINDMHPAMVMHPYKPQLNGKDLSENKDPNGKRLFVEMANVCREKGEGFVDYHWPKYGAEEPQPKLSFVKLFEPWGWIIGSGLYLEVAAERLKSDSASVIGALRFGPDNKDYFWINDMHPAMVMHPYKPQLNGKDLSENKDPNGKRLFVEMANVCREKGEGFVDYHWPKYGAEEPQPKLSFVKLFEPWGWIVGTGVYIDDMDALAAVKTLELNEKIRTLVQKTQNHVAQIREGIQESVRKVLIWIGGITLGVLVLMLAGTYVFVRRSIVLPIQRAIGGMSEASVHVASGANEVSMTAQSTAEGASQQAAAIEETSASLEEMSSMTRQNANNAKAADTLIEALNQVVKNADDVMKELSQSMEDITEASHETSKIIKTIDEIAFQTNLLALNAAVEAARAGEAGAGFAVVADEVRNLAMRAAEAAKNTSTLIQGNVKKIGDGTTLVAKANEAFSTVSGSAAEVGDLVSGISASSTEQAQGVEQINVAVNDMDRVVQQNAASAEESASASEQMRAQSEKLLTIIDRLSGMVGGKKEGRIKPDEAVLQNAPSKVALSDPGKAGSMLMVGDE